MAAPFVPLPVDWTGAFRPWTRRLLDSPPPGSSAGPWAPSAEYWKRPRGDMLDGASMLPDGEGRGRDGWAERPITPTLLGYEILEERAKFTVFKIHVTTAQGDSWVIFRRYTDFCRLNDKAYPSNTLKDLFPSSCLALPPKRWFKDNYDEEFLEERLSGLQAFLQSLTLHKDIISSKAVTDFLCLVDPPGPFDSLVESRAFCETLEETNHRLQRELLDNQREVDALKKRLQEKEKHFSLLVKKARSLLPPSESSESPCQQTETKATHQGGDTGVNGQEQKHTDGGDGDDEDRGESQTEVDKELNYETTSHIYSLCYWY